MNQKLLSTMVSANEMPKLIVFDLDYTLWAQYICQGGGPPYRLNAQQTCLYDARGGIVKYHSDVPAIMQWIQQQQNKGFQLGIASRSAKPDWAKIIINTLPLWSSTNSAISIGSSNALSSNNAASQHTILTNLIPESHIQIYPKSKREHFQTLHKQTKIAYRDMLFYDDEMANIRVVEGLGVTGYCVTKQKALNWDTFTQGLLVYWQKRKARNSMSRWLSGATLNANRVKNPASEHQHTAGRAQGELSGSNTKKKRQIEHDGNDAQDHSADVTKRAKVDGS